jgi:hypothetical protein
MARMPCRTSSWSSAINIRTGFVTSWATVAHPRLPHRRAAVLEFYRSRIMMWTTFERRDAEIV